MSAEEGPPLDDEWLHQANVELAAKECQACGKVATLSMKWELRPTGGSLAGQQLKAAMARLLICRCSACETAWKVTPVRKDEDG